MPNFFTLEPAILGQLGKRKKAWVYSLRMMSGLELQNPYNKERHVSASST
jgi:hypothetical protein